MNKINLLKKYIYYHFLYMEKCNNIQTHFQNINLNLLEKLNIIKKGISTQLLNLYKTITK